MQQVEAIHAYFEVSTLLQEGEGGHVAFQDGGQAQDPSRQRGEDKRRPMQL